MLKLGRKFKEVLLQLKDQLAEEATWEDADDFHKTFPNYILEDKDQTKGEAIVAVTPAGDSIRRSERANQEKNDKRFKDFIFSNH